MIAEKVTEAEFDNICREAKARAISSRMVTWNEDTTALGDYLYTVWLGLGSHLQWENPELHAKRDSQTIPDWLRDSIRDIITKHQTTPFSSDLILDKYLPEK